MEHTPPPLPPQSTTSSSATINCQWCSKPMNRDAINCPSCGKLRKDIYKEKIICYIFCIGGGLLVGFGGPMIKDKKQNFDFNNFNNADTSSGNGLAYTMLIVGIIAALIGLFYYFRISKKLKTYRWR